MAIIKEDYKWLWKDIEIRKGKKYKDSINFFMNETDKQTISDQKIYWIIYSLDEDLRAVFTKYIEVIEKAIYSSLIHDKKGKDLLKQRRWKSTTSQLLCAIIKEAECEYCKNELMYKETNDNKWLHEGFNKIITKKPYMQHQKSMNIFANDSLVMDSRKRDIIRNLRNDCQHYSFILLKWLTGEKDKIEEFVQLFNIHFKHTFALNILSIILTRFTTEHDDFAIKLIEKWEFILKYCQNISENNEWQKIIEPYGESVERYKEKFEGTDFLELSKELFAVEAKDSSAYKARKNLALDIHDYIRDYSNYMTIAIRQGEVGEDIFK